MERKSLLFFMLMTLFAPWTAKAQETPRATTATLPWSENFENYSSTTLGSEWATPATYDGKPCVLRGNSWASPAGSNSLECRTNSSNSNVFVFPQFDKPLNTLTVQFKIGGHTSGRGQFGYVTNASSASSFVSLTDIAQPSTVGNGSNGYTQYNYDLSTMSAPTSSSYRLAVKYTFVGSGEDSWYFDDFSVTFTEPSGFILNQNLNVDLTCGGSTYNFYDSGGASGNYSNSESYTAIFNCNSDITITFTSFVVESYSSNYDYLILYDGETQIAKLGGSSGSISGDITTATSYTATSGTLKAVWKSDSSQQRAGWNATITTGTCRYITEIYTPADWNAFCAAVNGGHSYSGETVTLMNNITTAVTTMAGETTGESTYNYAFKGTFDGQGHTLTVNLTSGTLSGDWYYTAPFRVIDGATIKNLKTTGTVTQNSGKGAAGLAGYTTGTCTITNCVSNVTINSLTNGDGTHGGFFSEIRGTTTMNNCAFTGSITGSSTRYCGGFVGWKSGTATFNNCVFAPTAITFDANHSGDNSANFSRNGGTFNNCYYTQTCGSDVQGKLMHSITGASGITVANAGTATSYTPETSTIVGYGTGIKFNNILYAANNENVSLNLSASTSGIFYADNATITGNSNPYTLAMPNEDVVVRIAPALTITATANPAAGGSVTGSGTFASGSSCTLTATANTGYAFANWTKNNVVVSTNASYTFTVSEDATYVANFEEWGVFISSTPASIECLAPNTQVVLTASTNVPYSPGLDQYVFNTGNDGSMITPQSWTTIVSSGNDDAASNVTGIGFTFTYDNVDYSNFSANSNGRMRLGDTKIGTTYSNPFTSSNYTSNTPAIVGVGRDCSTGLAGYVRTGLYGSEGSYVRVIEFKLHKDSSSSGTNYVMFQVQLFQANNEVRIVYSNEYSNAPDSYQIGIGNADHNKFWYVNPSAHSASYSTTYTSTTYSVYPGAGRYYSFTPSTPIYNWTCNAGTAGTANDNVYTVTPTENSTYMVSVTIGGQTYSETVDVTLTNFCATPTNLQCVRYTPTSATLSWTPGGEETQWHVQYGPQGSPNPQIVSTTDNPYVLTLTEGNTYDIQVRAVCDYDNGDWSEWSNTITVTPGTMKFIFTNNSGNGDNNWNTSTNWSPVGLPTTDDDVEIRANATIPSGYTALANDISFYYNPNTGDLDGSITIENGGQLQHNNEGVVVTVKRDIEAYGSDHANTNLGYKIISFPVSGIAPESEFIEGLLTETDVPDVPNNPYDFYTFYYNNQEENVYLEWMHVSNDDGLDPTMGYLYASQNGTTISVKGEVAPSLDLNYELYYEEGDAPFNGWQLVGNPFVCNAYLTAQGSHMDFYEIQDNDEYAEFVPINNTVEIPPMGGVMVWLHDNDNLVYSRTAPNSKGPGILNMDVNKASMRGTTMLDRARVRFGEGRNLKKLQLNPRHTKVYIPEGGKDFAVYYAQGAGTIPVNFKAEDNGRYTLDFSTEEVGFNYLHLIDNMNGNNVDLLQTPYYAFDAKSTDFASRFTLVFATGNDNDDTFAFFNNGVWIINNDGEATLQVVDALGRILSSETISGSCSKAINAAPGVYMLRLINGNDVKVQKVVVRR